MSLIKGVQDGASLSHSASVSSQVVSCVQIILC